MNERINLLENATGRNYAGILTKLRVIRYIAVGFLFLVATSSIMLFLIIAFSPLPRLRAEEQRYIDTLNAGEYRTKMDKYYYINSRLKDIAKLLGERPDVVKIYEIIERSLNADVRINFLDIAEEGMTLNLTSANLANIEQVVEKLSEQAKTDKRFRSLILSGISYDARDGEYEMIVTIQLNEA